MHKLIYGDSMMAKHRHALDDRHEKHHYKRKNYQRFNNSYNRLKGDYQKLPQNVLATHWIIYYVTLNL